MKSTERPDGARARFCEARLMRTMVRFVRKAVLPAAALVAVAGAMVGCKGDAPPPAERLETIHQVEVPEFLVDTIGEKSLISGFEWTPVMSYGLVYGLANTGSTVHPPGLRERMVKELSQYPEVTDPERILSDPSTAVVQISGLIPPGAVEDERFDLVVRVADGTQATSLEGGRLKGVDLRRIGQTRSAVVGFGMVLARGEGAIFVSPFARQERRAVADEEIIEDGVRRVDPRVGRILGGGRLTAAEPRTYQLTLLEPSARMADQIVRQINARFPGSARGRPDLKSVSVRVPQEYGHEKEHFLRIVTSIYLVESPDKREQRMRDLVDELRSGQDKVSAMYGLLAFGQPSAILLEPLLKEADDESSLYYSALSLARLGRVSSAKVLREFMLKEDSPYQAEAARALAYLPNGAGLPYLQGAFDVEKPNVRIAAYQALVRVAPDRVPRKILGQKVELGHVPSKGQPFIFISRQLIPRIVVFGDVQLDLPVLVDSPQFLVTARPHDDLVTVMSKRLGAEAAVQAEPRVESVVTALMIEAFDLSYSDVVMFLDRAHRQGSLKAPLVLEPLVDESRMGGASGAGGVTPGGEVQTVVPGGLNPVE